MVRITKKTMLTARRAEKAMAKVKSKTTDSFQNFGLNLGQGTDNALSGSTYGFNPITRNRTLLEWIHRGSWMGGVAVDMVAEDMTRAGIDITSDNKPEDIAKIQETLVTLGVWPGVTDTCKWSRLYGGAIGVMMVDGQDVSQPLEPDRVGKDQFRGILPLDRWMVEPSLNDLVQEQGPHIGLPKFYSTASNTSGYRFTKIHYSRVIRLEGIRLPYWQRVSENLWGISVIERLYDRMVAFDSATTGAAQMAYKSHVRTYKLEGLRELIAAGGEALQAVYQYVDMMRRFQGIEGITLLDSKDDVAVMTPANMTGMSDVLLQFGQQLSGALQIPLVRLFGQSPAGLNSTGESDLRTYYDGIAQQQESNLLVPMKNIVKMAALSNGVKLKDDFSVKFRPLWQLSEEQKSEVSARDTTSILDAEERGVITQKQAMQELKQNSKTTGRFSNITDEDIEAASDELAPRGEEAMQQQQDMTEHAASLEGADNDEGKNDAKEPKSPKGPKDNAPRWPLTTNPNGLSLTPSPIVPDREPPARSRDSLPISHWMGVDVAVETMRGSIRSGPGWQSVQPADYGYIRRMPSAEGVDEWMDCYISPERVQGDAYVVDGYTPDGVFDEHKVMLGYPSPQRALEDYHSAYGDGRRAGGITPMSIDRLTAWMQSGDVTRPLAPKNLRLAANGGRAA